MKTKAQKQESLQRGETLMKGSRTMVFADFSKLTSQQIRALRVALREVEAKMFVMKKTILGVMFKKHGVAMDPTTLSGSVGTIFTAGDVEKISGPVYKFFKELKTAQEKILGAYDLADKKAIEAAQVIAIGQLPPREVLLAQVLGMMAAPLRAFLYVLDQKSQSETK